MLKEGTIIGKRYEVVNRIGGGGMADVYKANDNKLNRMVAVKVMKSEFQEDPTFISKFRKEAQSAAGLSHPNIVNVYDFGDENGLYYIVMELVEGITLKDYIVRKGKLSVKEATSIAIQVSLGLQAAHNRGIIHRDVKPQNIIISVDGKVKLSDFGIAKATNSNTITSNVMGSVHYSSPEQVRGGFSNEKSDIYSLGITLYEMVTGRVPFDGETTVAIAIKHLQEEIVPPSKYAPGLPYALEQIILKCTQKSPDRRYSNMTELIDDLKHSLMDPQGNFVGIAPLSSHAKTVMLSPEEMEDIRNTQVRDSGDTTENMYADLDSTDDEDYDGNDDDDDDYDDYDDDDDEKSGLEKGITIASFIIGALIVVILIFFIAKAAGIMGAGKKNKPTVTPEPTQIEEDKDKDSSNNDAADKDKTENTEPVKPANEDNQVTVPDITNKTQQEAMDLLNSLNLGGRYTGEENSDTVEEGKVSSQEIAAGQKIEKNTTVNFKISTGKAQIEVPSEITGVSQADATAKLAALGLIVSDHVEKQNSDSVAAGNVITTSPAPGSKVAPGSEISMIVSNGPKSTPVPEKPNDNDDSNKGNTNGEGDSTNASDVPIGNYSGSPVSTVKAKLEASGLTVKVVYTSEGKVGKGEIVGQDVPDGSKLASGKTITLTVYDPDKAG
ncbi:Stk1 family PASTA domain-containing Ser/Thr kinase [Blautia liquoris]|uniref:non-specific serine/threonine protein kinase n=1 Tax=Blautia liquoris TaxID=2779518 RepID=A0A7M2RKY1_9FIRM|nr:Stk1 family PASTA domain-containing Ser/Thr kinase [Blautia liquoris]QOV20217.1 Stk1 family PASTA domain-containing Ser/Thr kinase [Blautia liquoris]